MRTTQKKKSIYWAFGIIAVSLAVYVLFPTVLDVRHPRVDGALEVRLTNENETSIVRHPREGEDPGSQESQNNTSTESKEEKPLDSRSTCFDSSKQKYPCGVRGNDVEVATLTISNESLEFPLTEEMTVYDAMNLLKEEGKLTFEGKNYPALGFFVTSINSISAGGGKNLFYYINGEEASVGISTYQIKEGDSIEWKLK